MDWLTFIASPVVGVAFGFAVAIVYDKLKVGRQLREAIKTYVLTVAETPAIDYQRLSEEGASQEDTIALENGHTRRVNAMTRMVWAIDNIYPFTTGGARRLNEVKEKIHFMGTKEAFLHGWLLPTPEQGKGSLDPFPVERGRWDKEHTERYLILRALQKIPWLWMGRCDCGCYQSALGKAAKAPPVTVGGGHVESTM